MKFMARIFTREASKSLVAARPQEPPSDGLAPPLVGRDDEDDIEPEGPAEDLFEDE